MAAPPASPGHVQTTETLVRLYVFLSQSLDRCLDETSRGSFPEKDQQAFANFYFAANRGNVVNLLPFWKVSPTAVADLERHLRRALELDPRHPRALHMMGILLDRTPGPLRLLLVGKRDQVEGYLTRAVEADAGRYAYIRWSLAEHYRDAGQPAQARAQAQALLAMAHPVDRRMWAETYRPLAEALLKSLIPR